MDIRIRIPQLLFCFYIWGIQQSIIESLFYYISVITGVLVISLYFFQNRKNTGFIFIFFYLIYSILSDIILNPIIKYYTHSIFIGFRLFTILEYFFITFYLYSIIKNLNFKFLIKVLSFSFLTYSIFDYFQSKSNTFDSNPTGVACILILFYSIYYLFEKIRTPENLFLYSTPNFWIVVGIILFFSGTFFVFIFSQSNYNDPSFQSAFQLINTSFSILRNLLFSIAFLIKPEKGKQNFLTKF